MTNTNAKPILLVEDNPDDVELTRRALRKANLANELVVARDGAEALDLLHGNGKDEDGQQSFRPSLVLLDLKLPKVDGVEVLEKIRTHPQTKYLPVVILTSSNEQQDLLDCYDLHCNSYIRKPVDFNQFTEAVAHMGLYWLVLNEAIDGE